MIGSAIRLRRIVSASDCPETVSAIRKTVKIKLMFAKKVDGAAAQNEKKLSEKE